MGFFPLTNGDGCYTLKEPAHTGAAYPEARLTPSITNAVGAVHSPFHSTLTTNSKFMLITPTRRQAKKEKDAKP